MLSLTRDAVWLMSRLGSKQDQPCCLPGRCAMLSSSNAVASNFLTASQQRCKALQSSMAAS